MRVAVVGATGAVGSTMLGVMRERSLPRRRGRAVRLRALGRAQRSTTATADLEVGRCRDEAIQGFDLALFSAGSATSEEWAPRFADAGAVVVDNSSHWRMHDDVPLVVAEVNPEALDAHRGIVANPNCTTMQTVVALKPILDAAGIERVVVSTYQAVSGTGQRAVEELHDQAEAILEAKELPAAERLPAPDRLQRAAAGRDVQGRRRLHDRGAQGDGARRARSSAATDIGDLGHLRARAGLTGHSESVNVQTREPLSPEECRELLAAAPGVSWSTTPRDGLYPLALDAAGRDDVLVGRIRRDPSHERCLNLWIVGDNLRKGAATNAVQLAELLRVRGLLRAAARRSRPDGSTRRRHVGPAVSSAGQLAPRGDAELAVDVARVRAHGLHADRQRLGDLGVGGAPPGAARAPRASRGVSRSEPWMPGRRRRPLRPSAAARASRARPGGSS